MRGTKHLSLDQKQAILEVYWQCLNVKQTASSVGVSYEQTRHWLKKNQIKPPGFQGGVCYQHIDELRAWASDGLSLSEMGRRIGTDHDTVAKFLEKHLIPRTPFLQRGENNPAWKGGRTTDKDGYSLVLQPDHPAANNAGYVREHRLVMEALLGRYLTALEVVHHEDDNKLNNSPENLELYDSNGKHLAETLKGKCPKWSEEGKARILSGSRRKKPRRAATILAASVPDGQQSPQTTDQTEG